MGIAAGVAKSRPGGLLDRYRDAYGVAAGTVKFGNMVKQLSIIVGGAIGVLSLVGGILSSSFFALVVGVLFGGFVLIFGYISGTLIAAQGQFMSAMLDTAVNTSPHLQDSEKASIMSL
jgi:hypothetical protein